MKTLVGLLLILGLNGHAQIKVLMNKDSLAKKTKVLQKGSSGKGLTNEEVVRGLKEALTIGTSKSATLAGSLDGFYRNPRLFIPWPEEAQDMKNKLVKLGFAKKVQEFEMSLNRAAEEAATGAVPIFTAAIANMSLQDGFAILRGADTSATNYLRKNTYDPLQEKFLPVVQAAIKKVDVTRYWSSVAETYNMLPGVKKQNPDLDLYVTNKAINGLMVLIADEETKIRKDPMARVTDLLKKVFGK
jgi:hypothetical protein